MVDLIASAIAPCQIDPNCLETDNVDQYLATLYLVTGKGNRRHKEVTTATNNYRTITGQNGASYILQSPKLRRYWLDFAKGRDLFLLGPFDINKAIDDIDIQGTTDGIDPYSIMASGYTMPYSAIAEDIHTDLRLRTYVRQYKAWFEQTHYGHWYEISRGYQRNPALLDLPPEEMHLRALDLLQNPKPEKLAPVWPWVSEQNPIKQISSTNSLVPIDNYELLKDTGIKLHNCAANYGHLIQSKQALLVSYYRNNKPIALCQYDAQGKIIQALGPCNTKPTKDALQAFQTYQPTI